MINDATDTIIFTTIELISFYLLTSGPTIDINNNFSHFVKLCLGVFYCFIYCKVGFCNVMNLMLEQAQWGLRRFKLESQRFLMVIMVPKLVIWLQSFYWSISFCILIFFWMQHIQSYHQSNPPEDCQIEEYMILFFKCLIWMKEPGKDYLDFLRCFLPTR